MNHERRCKFENPNGVQCRRYANKGTNFCYHHQPDESDEQAVSTRLSTTEDLCEVVSDALLAARHGRISPGQAYAVGHLAQVWVQLRKEVGYERGRKELADLLPSLMAAESEGMPQLESPSPHLELPAGQPELAARLRLPAAVAKLLSSPKDAAPKSKSAAGGS